MSIYRQIVAVTLMGLRCMPQRLGMAFVIVIGIGGVVGVLVGVLALANGLSRALLNTGQGDRAIVLSANATSEFNSGLPRQQANAITDMPGIRLDPDDKPIASAEVLSILKVRSTDGVPVNVVLRGIGPEGLALRPEVRLIAGRMFNPGVREIIVGQVAQGEFSGVAIGNVVTFRNGDWTVVGAFMSGNVLESGALADAETILSATGRNTYQSVTALLQSPQAFDQFTEALAANPTLTVKAKRESDYYAEQTKDRTDGLFRIGYIVGTIMAIGALFAALNAMYSAVSARSMEIATLRALGFGATAVVISVFLEAILLSLAGGLLGAGGTWLLFHGHVVSTKLGSSSQTVFASTVSPSVLVTGLIWALAIGLVGGLLPAVRAARLPVATALQVR